MGKYIYLQWKRFARFLPGALCVVLVLLAGLMIVFTMMVQFDEVSEKNQKIRIAMVGTADDSMIQLGLAALKNFDSTQFSLELLEMTEEDAREALKSGYIDVYLVIPEGFVEEALNGNILPLKCVTTSGAASMVTVFKEELSKVISSLLLESQKAVYGMQQAMRDQEIGGRGGKMNDLALTCVEYVLLRDRLYSLESLGIADSMGMGDALLCGLAVLLLHLACLPFAPVMIRRDLSLSRMLSARGRGVVAQALCDLAVYAGGLLLLVVILLVGAGLIVEGLDAADILVRSLPVLFTVCCFSFMLYALSNELIGGVLLQFFVGLALCFVSGCMYPVFFFPVSVQKLAAWLPTGLARTQLSGCITGETDGKALVLLLAYGAAFCAVGVVARVRAVKEARV